MRKVLVCLPVLISILIFSVAPGFAESKSPHLGRVDLNSGSFQTTVPIEVPKFRGLEPKINLQYDSRASNGLLGWGWRLVATSYIERKSYTNGAPYYDDSGTDKDIFVMDGIELLPCADMSPDPCGNTFGGTHRPKTENFHRIEYDRKLPQKVDHS